MASDFGCFCLFVVDMSFNPGWWLAPCQASKPDEKSTKADKKARSCRSGHGASGDQNGFEVVFACSENIGMHLHGRTGCYPPIGFFYLGVL